MVVSNQLNILNTMATLRLEYTPPKQHLKVVKNSMKRIPKADTKIYINTLMPDFKYTNDKGVVICAKNCIYM